MVRISKAREQVGNCRQRRRNFGIRGGVPAVGADQDLIQMAMAIKRDIVIKGDTNVAPDRRLMSAAEKFVIVQ